MAENQHEIEIKKFLKFVTFIRERIADIDKGIKILKDPVVAEKPRISVSYDFINSSGIYVPFNQELATAMFEANLKNMQELQDESNRILEKMTALFDMEVLKRRLNL